MKQTIVVKYGVIDFYNALLYIHLRIYLSADYS